MRISTDGVVVVIDETKILIVQSKPHEAGTATHGCYEVAVCLGSGVFVNFTATKTELGALEAAVQRNETRNKGGAA